MTRTIAALFDTQSAAEQAVQALMNGGLSRDQISIVARDAQGNTAEVSGAGNAGAGAVGGGVLGGVLGLLVGVGALAIPGIGPVLAVGPLAAAIGSAGAGTLLGAGIGAATGGLLGALVDAGLPENEANFYAEGVRRGGTLVTARVDESQVPSVMATFQRYGSVDLDARGNEYRTSGWNNFDPEGGEWERSSKVGTGTGAAAGAATGAAIGAAGGPVGAVVGGIAGAVTGGAAGAAGDSVGQDAAESDGTHSGSRTTTSYSNTTRSTNDPEGGEWDRSSKVGTGTGVAAGAATGATIGAAGGPVGAVIGGVAGAVTGGVAGAAGDSVGQDAAESDSANAPRMGHNDSYDRTTNRPITGSTYSGSSVNDDIRHATHNAGDPEGGEWERSSKVGTAAGGLSGAATGAAIGAVGGPVGAVVGGIAGAVAGGATGAAGDALGQEADESIDADGHDDSDVSGRRGQIKPRV